MKAIQVFSTAVLLLIPAAAGTAYGQEPREQEKQPEQKQEQQAKPAQQPQRAEHQQEAKPTQQSQSAEHQQQARPAPQQVKPAQPQQHAERQQQAKPAQQQPQRAQAAQQASGTQRAGTQQAGTHGRIPDDRFRASFGSSHTFHVSRSQFAGSSRRFQYGGYWFAAVDPWPVGWLYTDSVYVDYRNGGYFLCDPIHPGVFLSINIG
jgi:outer membrane biosynthesis protein TonB